MGWLQGLVHPDQLAVGPIGAPAHLDVLAGPLREWLINRGPEERVCLGILDLLKAPVIEVVELILPVHLLGAHVLGAPATGTSGLVLGLGVLSGHSLCDTGSSRSGPDGSTSGSVFGMGLGRVHQFRMSLIVLRLDQHVEQLVNTVPVSCENSVVDGVLDVENNVVHLSRYLLMVLMLVLVLVLVLVIGIVCF
jgi:hypothetical protein